LTRARYIWNMPVSRSNTEALDRLHATGLRPTRQRLALARLLFQGSPQDRHVTAEQLHSEAQKHGVRVSLATVYNTLHQFTAAGLLREVTVEAGRTYFDTNVSDHHHFFAPDSATLIDIASADVSVRDIPAPPSGTQIDRVDVVVRLKGR
jgi:Fur family transcriptional regulator, iron response regulator